MSIRAVLASLLRNKSRFETRCLSSLIPSSRERNKIVEREISRLKSLNKKADASNEFKRITNRLIKFNRHKDALEMFAWIESQGFLDFSPVDHARRLELIIKVHGLSEAENYFVHLTDSASQKTASLALLHGYVKERDTEKAEALMIKLNGLGLIVSPHPFNEMMKLYMSTCQYEKVSLVISQMKRNKVPRTVLSYNLWLGACSEGSDVTKAEMVYKEMVNDENVTVGWSTISTLANIYIKAGLIEKAKLALKNAESKLSRNNRLGFFFLITQYASLKDKEAALRLWEASKFVGGRITCANYMCILSCLVKVGDLAEAERIFLEWESSCRKYDTRVSNILLGAYIRNGLVEKAELLHRRTIERAGRPNYKTWEILLEGWIKSNQMDKAINAMKKAFSLSKHCHWRPSDGALMAIAEYFENQGNIEDAIHYTRIVHRLGLGSLSLYKLLLRMHLRAQRPLLDILQMMEEDKIMMDEEACTLVQSFS